MLLEEEKVFKPPPKVKKIANKVQ